MKAIVYRRYGSPDVLALEEIEKPAPGDDELLIRVRAASANPYDWHFMRGVPYLMRIMSGFPKPKSPRLGADVAGEVEAVGKNVREFKIGDAVFGVAKGSFAEYAFTSESDVALKPANVSFEQATTVGIAGFTALQSLRDRGLIKSDQRVLINGAAGGVGTYAVQIAKSLGAHVTGVCSTRNIEMVRSIGADRVIDYTREDFTQDTERYDLFLDCIGNHSLSDRIRVLTPNGRYVAAGGRSGQWGFIALFGLMEKVVWSWFVSQRLLGVFAKKNKGDLLILQDLLGSGKVVPVIDRCYKLAETAEAIRYLEEGHARGKVVIVME